MTAARLLPLLSLLTVVACGPKNPADDTGGGSTGSTGSAATSDGPTAPTSTGDDGTGTPGNPSVPTSATDGSASTGDPTIDPATSTFPDTTTGDPIACDLNMPDCPEGQKCTVVSDDGQLSGGHFECKPIHPDAKPPGSMCTTFRDPNDGTDDCADGSICFDLDDTPDGIGKCVGFCRFTEDAPVCAVPGELCVGLTCQSCTWSFCLPPCDLRDPSTCDAGEVCIPDGGGAGWFCALDASEADGGPASPCDFANDCDPGLACVGPQLFADCKGVNGCCAAGCDTEDPDPCPGQPPDVVCVPWYEDGTAPTPELATLGVCGLAQ